MTDPEQVADAIYAVQRAMEGWQRAALAAVSACRKEQEATWDTVQMSGRAAMEARIRAENQTQDLRGFQSSVEGSRCNLAAAADTVEMSSRRHPALAAHVAKTHAAWSGHLERARCDHQAAVQQLNAAGWAERVASERLRAAQAQVEGVRGRYRAAALAELRQAELGYQDAAARRRQAAMWEVEQRARVERCGRALALAQQAEEVLGSGAAALGTAAQAVETGRARWSEAQQATNSAQAHLGKMAQHASEAVRHANRADEHLTTATRHLGESEDWLRQGYLLADHAAGDMSEQIQQLLRADRPMGGGGASGAGDATEAAPEAHTVRRFGTGRGPHSADVTIARDGKSIARATIDSGGMTDDERTLGFPRSTLATHTEARAIRRFKLQPSDIMIIRGQYPPCSSCKGAMNMAAKQQHATIKYEWPGGQWVAKGQ